MWSKVSTSFFCKCLSKHHLLKRLLFPHWMVWYNCWKSVEYGCLVLLLDSQFYSVGLYVYPCASGTISWLVWPCSKFRNQELWELHLKNWFGHSGSLAIDMNFRISLSSSYYIESAGILIVIALNLEITLGSIVILTMLRLPVHYLRMFSQLCWLS